MATQRIIYHADGTKTETTRRYRDEGEPTENFHQNVIDTYYHCEQRGQLAHINGKTKQKIRDLHLAAQSPSYWEN